VATLVQQQQQQWTLVVVVVVVVQPRVPSHLCTLHSSRRHLQWQHLQQQQQQMMAWGVEGAAGQTRGDGVQLHQQEARPRPRHPLKLHLLRHRHPLQQQACHRAWGCLWEWRGS
jgi:hypothetical protein